MIGTCPQVKRLCIAYPCKQDKYFVSIPYQQGFTMMSSTPSIEPVNTMTTAVEIGTHRRLRSGTTARRARLSSSTLRIWEHRYGVVSPPKSSSGQRTYSVENVQRLRLIKQLTLEGHAIGTVANLAVDALMRLSTGNQMTSSNEHRVLVVGHTLAHRLEGRLRPSPATVFDDLAHVEREVAQCGAADVLVVHVASLQASVAERVLAPRIDLPSRMVVMVCSFGTAPSADALLAADVTVRREPVTGKELARLIVASKPVLNPKANGARTKARLYSDAELVSLAETPSRVACDCPRHLGEIVTLLVGFELYSADCALRSETDAALHQRLDEVTA